MVPRGPAGAVRGPPGGPQDPGKATKGTLDAGALLGGPGVSTVRRTNVAWEGLQQGPEGASPRHTWCCPAPSEGACSSPPQMNQFFLAPGLSGRGQGSRAPAV